MGHGDVGGTSDMYGNQLALRRLTTRMHMEDAWWDDMLRLEWSKSAHGMAIDTDNVLVVVDPNNNQLKHENDVEKEDMDYERGWRQRCLSTTARRTGRSA